METRAVQRRRVNTVILSTACIALALSITVNACGSPQEPPFRIGSPAVTLSPTSLAFGSQPVGKTSTAHDVNLRNTGERPLSITRLALTGTNASNFAQTNTCGSSVKVGANCTISVTFTPSARGSRTASLSITDNASGSPQTVSLSGTGAAALVSLSSTSLAFGKQPVGTPSTARTLTLSNTGNTTLGITSLALAGTNASDFAQTNKCGSSLAAGAKCTISVTFTPAASGSRTASLSITDNASGSHQTVSLSGTGTSTAPGDTAALVGLSATSLSFVDTTCTAQTLTLTNTSTGTATLSITSIAFNGANASEFDQSSTTCAIGSPLAAGDYCTIDVMFTPSVIGAEAASLSISDNASGSPQTVSLSGTTQDVILSWTGSTTPPDVVGYNVYRGTASGGESTTPLNSSPVAAGCTSPTTCTYTDATVVAATAYYYKLTAVASDGTQSAPSQEARIGCPN
jgi:hypothetical protein